jgi:hypothetical protein
MDFPQAVNKDLTLARFAIMNSFAQTKAGEEPSAGPAAGRRAAWGPGGDGLGVPTENIIAIE